ncbi:hypothetical protein HNQ80_004737 [Anaerosolibacter carboniphilus]|uniref:ECF transporter S component n=1 Tax=Anaerosolibacter carboniphilus TaxID=1417629 RepID=A0A841KZ08_9FIRM|nr:ECF transporter S component [Anaerosolibacter carboniphilus]MBB6218563.1 hypothetical protein [Anaerosolibacter carboniphilus]
MNQGTQKITRIGILLALTLAIQLMTLPQLITGTAINAMLLISASTVGVVPAMMIGCITPIVALMVGIMKTPMAPVIPFIIGANAALVLVYGYIQNRNKYMAIILAAAGKFLVLWAAVKWILISMLPGPLWEKVAITFGITQLFTALGGGVIALAVVPFLHNYLNKENQMKL